MLSRNLLYQLRQIPAALCCLIMLAACSPQYATQYRYFAPETNKGKGCANNCLMNKTNADLACTLQQQQCYQRARAQEQFDEFLYRSSYYGNGIGMSAYRPSYFPSSTAYTFCRADTCFDTTLQTYHQCFSACGGKITEETVCVAHCPEPRIR